MITKDIESLVTNPYIVPALRFKEVLIRYFGHFYAVNGGTYPLSPRKNTGKHRSTSKNAFVLVSAKISQCWYPGGVCTATPCYANFCFVPPITADAARECSHK